MAQRRPVRGDRPRQDESARVSGDDLLVRIAQRLSDAVRPGDTVARLGGDEFVVVCEQVTSAAHARILAERLAGLVAGSYQVGGTDLFTSASIGVALGRAGDSTEALLSDADAAMYLAKERGRGRVELFRPHLRARAESRLAAEGALRQALEADEFVLAFQPVVDLEVGCVVAAEALIRWRRPGDNIVPPADFIPIAEQTGLIIPLGQWVLEEACRQVVDWEMQYPQNPPLTWLWAGTSGYELVDT